MLPADSSLRRRKQAMSGRRPLLRLLLPVIVVLTAAGCRQGNGLPDSGGRPYEVLLVGDTGKIIDSLLSEPMPGLPQDEPQMGVSHTGKRGLNGIARLARNIVEVDVNARQYRTTALQSKQDVFASPQTFVRITTPSMEHLRRFLARNGYRLTNFLVRAELNRIQKQLERNHNEEAMQKIRKTFGVSMLVPADMTSSKREQDFLWLSNNANTGMASICLYTINKEKNFRQQRDSVMQRNIPGERAGMYVSTAIVEREEVRPSLSTTYRGLWEMRNDVMGGPFVAYLPTKLAKGNRQLVVEAFLFAPGSKKRNLLRRLEAALYTIQKPNM